ncbi:MAG TPA: acyltransferase [Gemmatimonadales bacterium]|nr:acyltransferase [Gemmatimonadales bacterium]
MAIPAPEASPPGQHSATPAARLIPLDALRAVAVLLVMGRHLHVPASLPQDSVLRAVGEAWVRGGWIGVDLFFVLSGFLVSGLLFREHQQHGRFLVGRFLLRRGLKIYPAFYFFLAVTVALQVSWGRPPDTWRVLSEVFFVQNYFGGVWSHTWSLAVEEHFYLTIPLLLVLLDRRTSPAQRPFRALPWITAALAIGLLAARTVNGLTRPYHHGTHLFPTHLRIDGLMLGVLLSWAYHYHAEALRTLLHRRRALLAAAGVLLLTPAFLWPVETTFALPTIGLTAFAVGSACLMGAGLAAPASWQERLRPLARVGAYSYSIYLWHWPMLAWAVPAIERAVGAPLPFLARVILYVTLSIIFGVGIARLVEFRVLRLRDRWFPSRSRSLAPAT